MQKAKAEVKDKGLSPVTRHLPRVTRHASRGYEQTVLRMKFVGANPKTRVKGQKELPGKANYFIGNDPKKWRTNVPTYAKVQYRDLDHGIDLIYYGNQRPLEYDFVVSPGADPNLIRLAFQGAKEITLADSGDLILTTEIGDVRLQKPLVYQLRKDGHKELIAGNYVIRPTLTEPVMRHASRVTRHASPVTVAFQIADYDASRPLIIDPVLFYSTYLGGGGDDTGFAIAVDDSGNAYVTGFTNSTDFPIATGAFQSTISSDYDVFITKLNPLGSGLVYSTFLGGSDLEGAEDIAVDAAGNAYVTGLIASTDFPTTLGAFQTTYGGGARDIFVTKLNPLGTGLVYSTYLGGSGEEVNGHIAVDAAGNAYVSGDTDSTNYPTTPGVFQTTYGGGISDAFVTKENPLGSALVYSTYLGGSGQEVARDIAVDAAGNAYVAGLTDSTNFPTTSNAFQTVFAGV